MSVIVRNEPEVRAATAAVYVAFIGAGVAMSSWATRIPQVRDGLGLTPSRLGLVLLAIAAGSIIALVMSGQLVARFGSQRTVVAMAGLLGVAVTGIALGYHLGVWPVVIGLFFFGFANGAWDVAMNVQGAIVERRLGKSIMSRFHAGFSVGTVGGALAGAGAIALGVPVTAHLIVAAVAVALTVILAVRAFVPDDSAGEDTATADAGQGARSGDAAAWDGAAGGRSGDAAAWDGVASGRPGDSSASDGVAGGRPSDAAGVGKERGGAPGVRRDEVPTGWRRTLVTWREPRTLLVGLFVMAFAFAEGAGIDWIAVAMIDDYGTSATLGTLTFALFLAAMTVGRWAGPELLDRYGRVPTLRVLAVVSLAGLVLFVFGGQTWMALVGALFWGLGASLGFPVGMSAAADDPARAAARVSVVASIGYCAFLGGPPLIGFLGDHITVQKGLIAIAVLLGVALTVVNAIRPLKVKPRT